MIKTLSTINLFGLLLLAAISLSPVAEASFSPTVRDMGEVTVQATQGWVATYAGQRGITPVIDAAGSIYVTGPSLLDAPHNYQEDIVLLKYNPTGAVAWVREFDELDDSTYGSDIPSWLTLDQAGNAIVVGTSFLNGSAARGIILKYDPQGTLLWKTRYLITAWHRVATDAAGNIYVTGSLASAASANYTTAKYDADGRMLWVRSYDGPSHYRDEPASLAVSPDGHVVVTGRSSGGATVDDIATILYSPDGDELWVRRYDGASRADSGNSVAFGPNGEVYVGGYQDLGSLIDTVLIKYDAAGTQAWVRAHNGSGNRSDSISRVAVDSLGNVVAIGYTEPAGDYADFLTLSYDPNGSQRWLQRYDGPAASDEEIARGLAIGPDNAVYVTGSEEWDRRIVTLKYDAGGVQQWVAAYDNAGTLQDRGWGVALNPSGNVIVTGQSPILTLQYAQESLPWPTATASPPLPPTATASPPPPPKATASPPPPTTTPSPSPSPTLAPSPPPAPTHTGFRSPGANGATSGGDGNGFEISPANAHANDGSFATDMNSGTSSATSCGDPGKDRHLFSAYGFTIPPGAMIDGIEVRLDAKSDKSAGSPKMCVELSWDGGLSWTAARATGTLSNREQSYLLGSSTERWGRAWSVAEFADSTFRVRVTNVSSAPARDFSLDWVAVRVHYR